MSPTEPLASALKSSDRSRQIVVLWPVLCASCVGSGGKKKPALRFSLAKYLEPKWLR